VDAGHDIVELGEDAVAEVERAVLEDVALGAAAEREAVEVLVE